MKKMNERKEDCFNCQFCREDGESCPCLVQVGGKPAPKKQVNEYLTGKVEKCPVMVKIRYR